MARGQFRRQATLSEARLILDAPTLCDTVKLMSAACEGSELGVQPFICITRRVELTRAGAAFYERSVRILGEVDLSAEIVRSGADKTTRKIAIGTVYPATIGVLPARRFVSVQELSFSDRACLTAPSIIGFASSLGFCESVDLVRLRPESLAS